jgi:hypothetical protein
MGWQLTAMRGRDPYSEAEGVATSARRGRR